MLGLLPSLARTQTPPGFPGMPGSASTAATSNVSRGLPETLSTNRANVSPSSQNNSMPQMTTDGFELSLMFSEVDLRNLKQVMNTLNLQARRTPESLRESGASEEDILAEILRQQQEEELAAASLPEFYLATLMFKNLGDWSAWIQPKNVTLETLYIPEEDREEITEVPRRIVLTSNDPVNELFGLSVTVLSEQEMIVTWKPKSVSAAFNRWRKKAELLEEFSVIKNRLVPGGEVTFDADKREFSARIRPNQTLSLDVMQIVEGRFNGAQILRQASSEEQPQQIPGGANINVNAPSLNAVPNRPQSMERNISNELLGNIRQLQQFIPQRNR